MILKTYIWKLLIPGILNNKNSIFRLVKVLLLDVLIPKIFQLPQIVLQPSKPVLKNQNSLILDVVWIVLQLLTCWLLVKNLQLICLIHLELEQKLLMPNHLAVIALQNPIRWQLKILDFVMAFFNEVVERHSLKKCHYKICYLNVIHYSHYFPLLQKFSKLVFS